MLCGAWGVYGSRLFGREESVSYTLGQASPDVQEWVGAILGSWKIQWKLLQWEYMPQLFRDASLPGIIIATMIESETNGTNDQDMDFTWFLAPDPQEPYKTPVSSHIPLIRK